MGSRFGTDAFRERCESKWPYSEKLWSMKSRSMFHFRTMEEDLANFLDR